MKERFESRSLSGPINIKMDDAKGRWVGDKTTIVANIMVIAEEYMRGGYTLTLRQLYYQLVSRDIIPNHDKVYAKISSIKDDCVYSGTVDWRAFEDRGRVPKIAYYEDSVSGALERTLDSYKLDRQLNQPVHVEVWTEKDAISSILSKVTHPYTIRLVINKGYTSSTSIYDSYIRFSEYIRSGIPVKILYFGDHDPSGLDMIRDIRDRLMFMLIRGERVFDTIDAFKWWEKYAQDNNYSIHDLIDKYPEYEAMEKLVHADYTGGSSDRLETMWDDSIKRFYIDENNLFEVIPVGLTMDQIKQYNPPHNPAKITDPRAKNYISEYGQVSWEVDALAPNIMISIVKDAINSIIDNDAYMAVLKQEKEDRKLLKEYIENSNGTS